MWTRWSPFDEMNTLFKEMDRLFRRSLTETGTPLRGGGSMSLLPGEATGTTVFTPPVEVFRKDKNLVLRAELPGINPEDVEITVVGNQLHLRGERKYNKEIDRNNFYVAESSYGRFERTFTLPEEVKPEDVKASYKQGIL